MRMGRVLRAGSALAALALIAGCTAVSAAQPAGTGGGNVCEYLQGSPSSGLNRAMQAAVAVAHSRLGVTAEVRAGLSADISPFMNGHCRLILGAGYQESAQIFGMADRDPRQRFLLADDWFDFSSAPDLTRPNVAVLAFEADQASFLAGYLAAAVSPDHVVGAYGSVNIPTVDLALNGFLAGARAWGEDHLTPVRILGWNGSGGPFVGNDVGRATAFSITSRLIRGGAHVIFGAAGGADLGAAAAAARHPSVYVIGMYTDGFSTSHQYPKQWLTSVVFDMSSPVLSAVRATARGGAGGGLYVGTLANGGVRLAPYHRLAPLVPRAVARKLSALRAGLGQGWISTNPADYVPREKETGNGNG